MYWILDNSKDKGLGSGPCFGSSGCYASKNAQDAYTSVMDYERLTAPTDGSSMFPFTFLDCMRSFRTFRGLERVRLEHVNIRRMVVPTVDIHLRLIALPLGISFHIVEP